MISFRNRLHRVFTGAPSAATVHRIDYAVFWCSSFFPLFLSRSGVQCWLSRFSLFLSLFQLVVCRLSPFERKPLVFLRSTLERSTAKG